MPRAPRIHFYGAVYHAMARGVDGREIYSDEIDRRAYLANLNRVLSESAATLLAYCLMGNHFHLAIRVAHVPLSVIMQRHLTPYAQGYNRRRKRTGHLFQARYKAKLCHDEAYLRTVIRYIHLNPVRSKIVEQAHHWPWSSLNGIPIEDDGIDLTDFDPWKDAEEIELDLKREMAPPENSLEEIAAEVSRKAHMKPGTLKGTNYDRDVIEVKRSFARKALSAGHRLARIADWLRCPMGTASRYARPKSESERPDP